MFLNAVYISPLKYKIFSEKHSKFYIFEIQKNWAIYLYKNYNCKVIIAKKNFFQTGFSVKRGTINIQNIFDISKIFLSLKTSYN